MTRLAHRQTGSLAAYDWLGWLAAAMPAALKAEAAQKRQMAPLPILDSNGGRKAGEAARQGVAAELLTPLSWASQVVEAA